MPVVSSSYVVGPPEADGRVLVTETHVLNVGAPVEALYVAAPNTDFAAVMSGRVARINEQLAEAEYQALIDRGT